MSENAPKKSGPPPVMKIRPEEAVEYYFVENDQAVGPMSKEEFVSHIRNGRSARNSQVWRTGDGEWQNADKHPESSRLFPPPIDPARKLVEFLIGTWALEFYRDNNTILQRN